MFCKFQQLCVYVIVGVIVEVGFILFVCYGVENIIIWYIVDIVGVSVGLFYEYFVNKEEVFDVMYEYMVWEVVGMVWLLIFMLVCMDICELVVELFYWFCDLLECDDGCYLCYMSYVVYFVLCDQIELINWLLMDLLMKYVMYYLWLVWLGNLLVMGFIMINGGVFMVICYFIEFNFIVVFDDLVCGLGDMVVYFVDGEL